MPDITADEISKLLWAAEAGNLDTLECPRCGASTVSVSYTNAAADKYRVYFICSKCTFRMGSGQASKPAHFSQDRIDADLQAFDVELLQKTKFPRP
jgi:hypothetical protein